MPCASYTYAGVYALVIVGALNAVPSLIVFIVYTRTRKDVAAIDRAGLVVVAIGVTAALREALAPRATASVLALHCSAGRTSIERLVRAVVGPRIANARAHLALAAAVGALATRDTYALVAAVLSASVAVTLSILDAKWIVAAFASRLLFRRYWSTTATCSSPTANSDRKRVAEILGTGIAVVAMSVVQTLDAFPCPAGAAAAAVVVGVLSLMDALATLVEVVTITPVVGAVVAVVAVELGVALVDTTADRDAGLVVVPPVAVQPLVTGVVILPDLAVTVFAVVLGAGDAVVAEDLLLDAGVVVAHPWCALVNHVATVAVDHAVIRVRRVGTPGLAVARVDGGGIGVIAGIGDVDAAPESHARINRAGVAVVAVYLCRLTTDTGRTYVVSAGIPIVAVQRQVLAGAVATAGVDGAKVPVVARKYCVDTTEHGVTRVDGARAVVVAEFCADVVLDTHTLLTVKNRTSTARRSALLGKFALLLRIVLDDVVHTTLGGASVDGRRIAVVDVDRIVGTTLNSVAKIRRARVAVIAERIIALVPTSFRRIAGVDSARHVVVAVELGLLTEENTPARVGRLFRIAHREMAEIAILCVAVVAVCDELALQVCRTPCLEAVRRRTRYLQMRTLFVRVALNRRRFVHLFRRCHLDLRPAIGLGGDLGGDISRLDGVGLQHERFLFVRAGVVAGALARDEVNANGHDEQAHQDRLDGNTLTAHGRPPPSRELV